MREIKFRVWSGNMWLCAKDANIHAVDPHGLEIDLISAFPHVRHTMCQYTGLKDKNGKEIYEGDVVELKRSQPNGDIHRFVVEWDAMKAGFYLTLVHMYPKDQESSLRNEFINAKNKTVIGNIYEHPELVK